MKSRWKTYFLYASLIVIGGGFIYLINETIQAKNTGFETKTLWDWMELLIIPLFLAGGAFYLNSSEKEIERKEAEDRAKLEREIAADRQYETALQSYLDRMAELLLEKKLQSTENEEIRDIARIRTLTVLRGLDPIRKGLVILFLYEAKLINKPTPKIDLKGADLMWINLRGEKLQDIELQNTNLLLADLYSADLEGTNLQNAELKGANLWKTNLQSADLQNADLYGALLWETKLQDADLSNTNLGRGIPPIFAFKDFNQKMKVLGDAELENAELNNVNLSGAKVTREQLASAKSLTGATMPDGTLHK